MRKSRAPNNARRTRRKRKRKKGLHLAWRGGAHGLSECSAVKEDLFRSFENPDLITAWAAEEKKEA